MSESNELIKIEDIKAVDVFTEDGIKPIIELIRERTLTEVPDMSTRKGRDRVKSLAFKVAKTKTALDSAGKELTEDWKKQAKIVDSARKLLREELDSIKDEVRKPLTEYENREKNRVAKLDAFYDNILELSKVTNAELDQPYSVPELEANLAELEGIVVDESLQERELDCIKAKQRGIEKLSTAIEDIKRREQQERELEELRIAQQKEEQERREREIAEQAEAKAREEAAAIMAQREREAKAREEAAKLELEQAKQREIEAAQRAEREREAAVKAEQERIKAEQERVEREAKEREANIKHKKKINNEAVKGFIDGGLSEEDAKTAVTLIAKGLIEHTKISY